MCSWVSFLLNLPANKVIFMTATNLQSEIAGHYHADIIGNHTNRLYG